MALRRAISGLLRWALGRPPLPPPPTPGWRLDLTPFRQELEALGQRAKGRCQVLDAPPVNPPPGLPSPPARPALPPRRRRRSLQPPG